MNIFLKGIRIELTKFSFVGAVNFVFTFILFYLFVRVFAINHLVALAAVSLLGMFLTYTLNYIWVFRPERKFRLKERLWKYLFAGFLSIGINVILLDLAVEQGGFDPFYSQVALIPLIVIINFSTSKYWTLRSSSRSGS